MNEDGKLRTDYKKVFGQNLKRYREFEEMTQAQLATVAECTPQYVSEVENGRANPTIESMEKLTYGVKRELPDMIKIPKL